MSKEDGFLKELLGMYKIEADEHIKALSSGLIDLEKCSDHESRMEIVESIYREAHSLKGASRAVNMLEVERLCQTLEGVFLLIKRGEIELTKEKFDLLHQAVDTLPELIESPEQRDARDIINDLERLQQGMSVEKKDEEKKVRTKRSDAEKGKEKSEEKKESQPPDTASPSQRSEARDALLTDTVRISTKKLDSLLLQVEEMLTVKLTLSEQSSEIGEMVGLVDALEKQMENLNHEIGKLKRMFSQNGEFDRSVVAAAKNLLENSSKNIESVHTLKERFSIVQSVSENNVRLLGGMVDTLLEDMKEVLMLPFSTLFKIIPKVVRDISRELGKEVDLNVKGSTIEVSRRILEEMKDPLIHLIRNCIDHGIEKPEVRKKHNKMVEGKISIEVVQLGANKVEILIKDDGAGIDLEKVKEKAIKNGVVSRTEADRLSDAEILSFIFQSGISTSPIITDISGRGLGLAIVRDKVEKLGGTVSLNTEPGKGTQFRIVLPVTLATFRGILVRVYDRLFVVPTNNVERVTRVNREDIKPVENRETISFNGIPVSFVWLADCLDIPRVKNKKQGSSYVQIIVLNSGERRIAFGVDEVMNEQEVLVKKLGKQLARVRNIEGAMIFGTGRVVPILNVSDLMKTAVKIEVTAVKEVKEIGGKHLKKSILIAEDSITSRTLLKNILESAGYRVKTAVDGMDAYTELRTDDFDLVVSDIEMPRMNGFELVRKIRENKKTSDLPVVLVTALESREDRERGIDVGANAYIVKRSFDQSNLLDVVKKLI